MKYSVLFVDNNKDDPQSFGNRLQLDQDSWELTLVASGKEALETMRKQKISILICQTNLTDMAGFALMKMVDRTSPHTVRIVLSEKAELENTLRTIPEAHQVIVLPCDPETMANSICRTSQLQKTLQKESLLAAIGSVKQLPALPRIYSDLVKIIADPDAGTAEIGELIRQDIGLTGKILKMANSAFYRPLSKITNVRVAATHLGINLIKNLVLTVTLYRHAEGRTGDDAFDPDALQLHTRRTAMVASDLMKGRLCKEDAFTAGMLHDAGKIILATSAPKELKEILQVSPDNSVPLYITEEEVLGTNHAEVGGYLLKEWGLPYPIIEAVTHHHHPSRAQQTAFDLVGAVHVANALVSEWEKENGKRNSESADLLDVDWLASLGVEDQVPAWRENAFALCTKTESAPV